MLVYLSQKLLSHFKIILGQNFAVKFCPIEQNLAVKVCRVRLNWFPKDGGEIGLTKSIPT